VGDAIYDFSEDPPQKQLGVHTVADRDHDLSGDYALLSKHLFCFGSRPRALPEHLHSTVIPL
jgi:putative DNA base modification enzyme with NMAD domain